MKLLVTGAAGFLGFRFSQAARYAGHEVTGVVRRPAKRLESIGVDVLIRDIRDVTSSDVRGSDAIVHFAAATSGDVETFLSVTVDGTAACLSAAIDADVPRFVHISSASVYPGRLPVSIRDTLDAPVEPHPERRGIYPQSKIRADQLVTRTWQEIHPKATEIIIVRPGLVFGQDMGSVLAGTAIEAPGGIILGLGRAEQRVPYVHVDDLSRGLVGLLGEPVHAGQIRVLDAIGETLPTKAELVQMHGYFTGRSRRAIWPPRTVMVGLAFLLERVLEPVRACNAMGYKVARYYDLEPDRLPAARFWRTAATRERVAATDAVREALTMDRGFPAAREPADPRVVAREHLAAASRNPGPQEGDEPQLIVLVGAGRVVEELHLPAIRALGLRVAAVVDRDLRAAAHLAAVVGGTAYGDLEDLPLAGIGGGTAVIATPGTTHAGLVDSAVALGWNVLLEKPAAVSRIEYDASVAAAATHKRLVTVMQNYRFRPATMALWRLLQSSDLGILVGASVDFQMGRISAERAGWSRDDRTAKAAITELAIHFIDIASSLAGPVTLNGPALVYRRRETGDTVSVTACGRSDTGADVSFTLGYDGTAQRTRILLSFERSTVELGFFPDGCRILPRRNTPIDDGVYSGLRLARFIGAKVPPRRFPVPQNAAGHLRLYRHHLRRATGAVSSSVCDLASIQPTMETVFALTDAVYEEPR